MNIFHTTSINKLIKHRTVRIALSFLVLQISWGGETAEDLPLPIAGMREEIEEVLKSQGWVEGPNRVQGSIIFVATGIGVVHKGPGVKGHNDSRNAAFDKAMLRAKQFMAEFMGEKIATQSVLSYSEGTGTQTLLEMGIPQTLAEKVHALAHAKLDSMLADHGVVEPRRVQQNDLMKLATSSEEYKRLTLQFAEAMLVGCQLYQVIENYTSTGEGQMGVILVHSPRLAEMAYAMVTGGDMPRAEPKAPLIDQLPQEPSNLLRNLGVSQRINEKGEYVLVSFGQATSITSSSQSQLMAERKARMQSMGQLRSFAGESVSIMTSLLESETVYEFEMQQKTRQQGGGIAEVVQTHAGALQIEGAQILRRWQFVNPDSGEQVIGVVMTWSPQQRDQVRKVRDAILSQERTENTPGHAPKNNGSRFSSESNTHKGINGDPDAF